MSLTIFHQASRRLFHGKRGKASPFGHTFGGSADYSGLTAHRRRPPVHLLFRLNTADPAVGVTVPGAQWLPLLCAIRYGACDLSYRVVSDEVVKILHQTEAKPWANFPYEGFPDKLPVIPVRFAEGSYDPAKVEDGLFYAGVFGYDALSPRQYARLVRRVEKEGVPELLGWESVDAYLKEGNGSPFVQGRPVDDCPDPACANHGREGSLRPFAIFREEPKEYRKLWGPHGGNLQIIYQVCPACAAILTSNQCT
jgi:hypothetical protein